MTKGKCPNCGGELVEKDSKNGTFLSCSNFPKCRFSMDYRPDYKELDLTTLTMCPNCGGELVKVLISRNVDILVIYDFEIIHFFYFFKFSFKFLISSFNSLFNSLDSINSFFISFNSFLRDSTSLSILSTFL